MMTKIAFVVGCVTRLGLFVGTAITVIVTTMAGIKNVAAIKFYLAVSLVVLTKPHGLAGDGLLLGRP